MIAKIPQPDIVVTPGAVLALRKAGQAASHFLQRHLSNDWGDLSENDRRLNDEAAKNGGQLLSSYRLQTGESILILTAADRSTICVLSPDEF